MFAGGLSSMVGEAIKDDDAEANAGMILNFLGNQVSLDKNSPLTPRWFNF